MIYNKILHIIQLNKHYIFAIQFMFFLHSINIKLNFYQNIQKIVSMKKFIKKFSKNSN